MHPPSPCWTNCCAGPKRCERCETEMEHEFWLQRWREGETRFHQERVMPLLQKYWPTLALPAESRVFVPLAGKSLDMRSEERRVGKERRCVWMGYKCRRARERP